MLPEASQARKAIWEAVNPRTGKRRIDEAFPKELRANTRDQDMLIRFKNGSTWQVVGSDNYNSLVGSPPVGVVFSEWSLADPNAWRYIRPILLENGGWAIFIWTPRTGSHAIKTFRSREASDDWFTQRLDALSTGVFTHEQLVSEKAELMSEAESPAEGEATYLSEYMVDFDAPTPGSYYAEHIHLAEKGLAYQVGTDGKYLLDKKGNILPLLKTKKRIGSVPWDRNVLVETAWDLGIDDYLSIWFFQRYATHVNIIDFYETSGQGFDAIKEDCFNPKPYIYGAHHLPHDVKVRELGAGGRSRKQTLQKLGFANILVGVPQAPTDRITAVRRILPHCYFDKEKCEAGIDHLKAYRKRWNASLRQYTGPLHDQHSHASDAFGEIAINVFIKDMPIVQEITPQNDHWGAIFAAARKRASGAGNWKTV